MPDLGKYALWVLSAYGATITLIVLLVVVSLWQGARMKKRLDAVERRAAEQRNA